MPTELEPPNIKHNSRKYRPNHSSFLLQEIWKKIGIFLSHFEPIFDLFWCQNRHFWPIINIKLELWFYFTSKVDATKKTLTVFCYKKYENIFGIFWGHFEPIFDLFWCQNRCFWPIFNIGYILFFIKVDETKHTSTVFWCKKYETIFGIFWGHFGPILGLFWCQNRFF